MSGLLPLLPPHLRLLIGSTAFFFALERVSPLITSKIIPRQWANFDARTKQSWRTKINSTIHACTILPLAISVMNSSSLAADPVFGYDKQVSNVLALTCGYFVWDTIDSALHSTAGFVVHGVACLAVYLFSFRPFLASFGPRFLLWELSTPFLNLHWFLEKLNLDKRYPRINQLNDIAFALSFFLARIVLGWYHSSLFFQAIYEQREKIPLYLLLIYGLGNLALNTPNALWFSKVIGKLRSPKPAKRSTHDGLIHSNGSLK